MLEFLVKLVTIEEYRVHIHRGIKKTWLAPEDTVFARIRLLASLSEGGRLVALMLPESI